MKPKYFTVVIRADDEKAARSLVPGELIRGNPITACSMGDAISLNGEFKKLIPDDKEEAMLAVEQSDLAPFFATR
jgi:hypothetical protein